MDTPTVEALRQAILSVFKEWERFPGPLSHFTIVPVVDLPNDRYLFQMVRRPQGLQASDTLAHLEIRDGKIWVEADGTEKGVAADLVAAGAPKDRIALSFYQVSVRQEGDFAVM